MTITTKKGDKVVYHQEMDDSTTLNATIAHLMQQPTGTAVTTTVSNNGHTMVFQNEEHPIGILVRKANGIITRENRPAAKPETA